MPAKTSSSVAAVKDLQQLRPGIHLAFCNCDPDERSGFSGVQPL